MHYEEEDVSLRRVCQTLKGMSEYKCVSNFDGYVKLWRVCQTLEGTSNLNGHVKLTMVCKTYNVM